MDIMPTVYNLALSNKRYYTLGNDLFDRSIDDFGVYMSLIYHKGGVYYPDGNPENQHGSWTSGKPGLVDFNKKSGTALSLKRLKKKYRALLGITEALLEAEYRLSEKK